MNKYQIDGFSIEVPKGLYEVLMSHKLTQQEKEDSVHMFSWPTRHLNSKGELMGVTDGELSEEDGELIIEALRDGRIPGAVELKP